MPTVDTPYRVWARRPGPAPTNPAGWSATIEAAGLHHRKRTRLDIKLLGLDGSVVATWERTLRGTVLTSFWLPLSTAEIQSITSWESGLVFEVRAEVIPLTILL